MTAPKVQFCPLGHDLVRWAILLSKSSGETVAERSLREAGYRSYLPWFRKLLQPHGRERYPALVMRLVFPGIVFVQAWEGFRHPLTGVEKAMPSYRGGPPATMADSDIALLMRREREGAFDEARPPHDLKIGGQYEFEKSGRLLSAVLEELSADGQATVRMVMFGRETRTQVDVQALRESLTNVQVLP